MPRCATTNRIAEPFPWYDFRADEMLPEAIDLLAIDGPPRKLDPLVRYPARPRLFLRLRPGATVFLDDAGRAGEKRVLELWRAQGRCSHVRTPVAEEGCARHTI